MFTWPVCPLCLHWLTSALYRLTAWRRLINHHGSGIWTFDLKDVFPHSDLVCKYYCLLVTTIAWFGRLSYNHEVQVRWLRPSISVCYVNTSAAAVGNPVMTQGLIVELWFMGSWVAFIVTISVIINVDQCLRHNYDNFMLILRIQSCNNLF